LAGKGSGSKDRKGRKLSSNSMSVVFRLVQDDKPIALLPGDIDDVGFQNLLEASIDISALFLIFPHHGGHPGAGEQGVFVQQFVKNANPEFVIFSIGRGQHNTPQPEIIEAILRANPKIKILCTQLSNHCSPKIPDDAPSHLVNKYSHGREQNKCCSGTILISVDGASINLLPALIEHNKFLDAFAPTALCKK
jgi:competence protein ComEC